MRVDELYTAGAKRFAQPTCTLAPPPEPATWLSPSDREDSSTVASPSSASGSNGFLSYARTCWVQCVESVRMHSAAQRHTCAVGQQTAAGVQNTDANPQELCRTEEFRRARRSQHRPGCLSVTCATQAYSEVWQFQRTTSRSAGLARLPRPPWLAGTVTGSDQAMRSEAFLMTCSAPAAALVGSGDEGACGRGPAADRNGRTGAGHGPWQ